MNRCPGSFRFLLLVIMALPFASTQVSSQTKPNVSLPDMILGKSDLTALSKSQTEFKGIPTDGPVNPDEYYVGPGDGFVLNIWSSAPEEHQLTVTPEGYLLIPAVGAVGVKNSTLAQARGKVVGLVEKKYANAVITFTLVNPRKLSVAIWGEVMNEGTQEAYSVQRVSALIEEANSLPSTQLTKKFYEQDRQELRTTASQRYIMVRHRDGSSQRVDLVKYAATGAGAQNPYLREGDAIFVPSRSDQDNRIGIYGGVTRNMTCEFVEGDSVTDLLQLGLELSPRAIPGAARLSRQSPNGEVMDTLHVDLRAITERRVPNISLQPGDILEIPEAREERTGSFISIEGEVEFPGNYPITKEKTKLSSVIRSAGGFTKDAYLPGAALMRSKGPPSASERLLYDERLLSGRAGMPSDTLFYFTESALRLKGEPVHVNFSKLFINGDSTEDVTLRKHDRIVIPTRTRTVYVFGEVTKPGHIPYVEGKNAAYYIDLAGGYSDEARSGDVKIIKGTTRTWLDPGETTVEDGDYIFVPKTTHYPFAYYLTTLTQAVGVIASLATVILVARTLK